MLVLKTNIYKSKLIIIQHFASLIREHYRSDTDFMDRLIKQLYSGFCKNPASYNLFLPLSFRNNLIEILWSLF